MTWWLWSGLVVSLLAVAWMALWAYGSTLWTGKIGALTRQLESARVGDEARPPFPARYDARELVDLPAPVQRYFRAVLKDGQPIITAATVDLAGTFNMSPTGEQWKPFTSRQRVTTRRPGFLWDAPRVAMLPGVPVRVVDSYVAGEGMLRAAVLGLFTAADVSGGGVMARGEFMRFFAESPGYPTVLLPSQGVKWSAVNSTSANATIVDGLLTLTLLFRFNDAGLIESVRAEARGGLVGNKVVMMPWECGLSNYEMRRGMLVPITGEAAWVRPEGRKPYFFGTVTSLSYEFSR